MKECPCLNCTKRYPACHGTCEDFYEWNDPIRRMKEEKEKDRMINDVSVEGARRRSRRRR